MKERYCGPFFLHHALVCMNAGNTAGAASWIERDWGEEDSRYRYGSIDPGSLQTVTNEFTGKTNIDFELFANTAAMAGEGI